MALNVTVANMTIAGMEDNESLYDNCSYIDFVEVDEDSNNLIKAAKLIDVILPPIILLIGIPGNTLTMVVILRQWKNLTSTAVYLFMLAITDTVFLMFGPLLDWIFAVVDYNIRESNSIVCKVCNMLYYWTAQFSSWLLVAITIERIISITVPHRYRQVCTRFISAVSGTCICCLLFTINIHFLYGFGIPGAYYEIYGDLCGPLVSMTDYLPFYFDIWPWMDFTILFAFPFIILCVGNSVILYKLRQIHSTRHNKSSDSDSKNRRSMRSITVLIVLLNVVFLICITPLSIFLISEKKLYEWVDEVICIDKEEYDYRQGLLKFAISFMISLSYINPSINFILYVLSGTKFRNEVKAIISCKPVRSENAFA